MANLLSTNVSGRLYVSGYTDTNTVNAAFRFYDGSTFRGGLGLDDWAHSGSAANITMYVQGDNNFFISTSGVKRAQFNSGAAIFRTYSPDTAYNIRITGGDQFNAYYNDSATTMYINWNGGTTRFGGEGRFNGSLYSSGYVWAENANVRVGEIWGYGGVYRSEGSMIFGVEGGAGWSFRAGNTEKVWIGNDGNIYMAWAGQYISTLLDAKQNASTAINTGNIGSQTVSVARQLISPNNANRVAADDAMPNAGHSFIHTLGFGPGDNDGHILGMTWADTTSSYGAQIFIDTDPNDIMAIRSRSSAGVWTGWKTVIHSGTIGSQSVSYASSAGTVSGNQSSSFGLNDNRLYLRTNGDTNHYLWNADDDWEELVYYTGTGFRVKGSTGVTAATFTDSGINLPSGSVAQFYTAAGSLRGYIQATDTDDNHFIIATSGGEDIVFKDGGLAGERNMVIRGNASVEAYGDFRAPIFYDSADTGYYLDPNSTSRLYHLEVWNNFDTATNDVYANMRVIRNNSYTDGMYIGYNNAGNGITRLFGGTDSAPLEKHPSYTYEPGSFRAPIFYDSNDTSYYLDPNGSTSLKMAGLIETTKSSGSIISTPAMGDSVGWNGDEGMYIGSNIGGTYYIYGNGRFYDNGTYRTLIHSGNIGSQSVSYASTAGNADTVDGYQASAFLYNQVSQLANTDLNDLTTQGVYHSGDQYGTNPNIPYANYFTMINLTNDSDRQAQLWFGDTPGTMYWRPRQGSSTWHGWEKVITSNNIGSQSVSNADTVDGFHASYAATANSIPTRDSDGYLAPEAWIRFNGAYGLYSPTNNAHFYPNDGSYGSWKILGSRNSYRGLQFGSGTNGDVSLMIHENSNITGFHNAVYDWQFYWSGGTLYCFKNTYGGGTQATVLDSSNYTSYSQFGGDVVSGNGVFASSTDGGRDCYLIIGDDNPTEYGVGYGGTFTFYGDTSSASSILYAGGGTFSGHLAAPNIYQNNKKVRDSNVRTTSGISNYYSGGNEGWYTVAKATLTSNCGNAEIYGTLYDHRYNGADAYQISVVFRTECNFTSDNESHYVNVGCTIIGSTYISNYQDKIRLVLSESSTNLRTYELQFYETAWNYDTWQLESESWTVYENAQAPRSTVGAERINYISHQSANYQVATGAMYAPIYYDRNDTNYYCDPNGTSRLYVVNDNGGETYGTKYFYSNKGSTTYLGSSDSPSLQAFCNDQGPAFMSFHRSGYYAVNFGLDPDNVIRLGGWSASASRMQLDMSGNVTFAGDVTAYSDARIKTNVQTIENALDKTLKLRGVTYNRTDSEDTSTKVGVIAQEILEVIPEVVNQDASGMYNVSYGNLTAVLIEAIKEQQKQIDELKEIINGLTK